MVRRDSEYKMQRNNNLIDLLPADMKKAPDFLEECKNFSPKIPSLYLAPYAYYRCFPLNFFERVPHAILCPEIFL